MLLNYREAVLTISHPVSTLLHSSAQLFFFYTTVLFSVKRFLFGKETVFTIFLAILYNLHTLRFAPPPPLFCAETFSTKLFLVFAVSQFLSLKVIILALHCYFFQCETIQLATLSIAETGSVFTIVADNSNVSLLKRLFIIPSFRHPPLHSCLLLCAITFRTNFCQNHNSNYATSFFRTSLSLSLSPFITKVIIKYGCGFFPLATGKPYPALFHSR